MSYRTLAGSRLLFRGLVTVAAALPLAFCLQVLPSATPAFAATYAETTGGVTHTWTNYTNAGGTQGPSIPSFDTVQIACRLTGFKVADGNTWWYQIASSPWNDTFYASADAFYNNGATSGPLKGTPFVDPNVPICGSNSQGGSNETTGGVAHTWTDYTDAGGTQGPSIGSNQTVSIACRLTGFKVPDGNTWWYLVGSAPWDSQFYVSADAFYNNGQTSGSLQGTPFVDTNVPICAANTEEPAYGTAVGSSSGAVHPNRCNSADPVDCASGDFWQTVTDVSVPGRGPGLDLTRTYNDLDGVTAGIFGNGWSSSYDQHLTFNSDGSVTVTLADGSQVVAEPNGSGGFTVPSWADSSLAVKGDGSYTYTRQARQLLTFAAGSSGASGSTGGQLLSIKDLNGYATVLSYNASGQLASVTDSSGRAINVTFGANGFVSSVTDPLGRTTKYGYDAVGDLTSVTDPLIRTWNFSYNGSHQMLTMTNPVGGVTTNTYNSGGQVTAQTDPQNLTTTFAYTGDNFSALGGTTTITDPHGNVEVEQYADGFMTKLTKGYGTAAAGTWTYTYDPNTFGITSVTDPDGNVTAHTYDAAGHLLTSTDPLGNLTTSTYNALGEVLTTTDPLGHVTTKTYDALGEVLTTTDPLGHVTTKTYDANGNLLTSTDPLGNSTTYTYGDGNAGDVTAITDPSGRVTTMTYDSDGDVATKAVSPSGGEADTTGYAYDVDGEVVCTASPDATAAGVTCPAAGSPPVADTTTTAYDGDGETTSVTDPDGNTTDYSYDADGNQVQQVDGTGNMTSSSYDEDNRLVMTTTGVNGAAPSTTAYSYDLAPGTGACQNLAGASYCTTVTNPNGGVTVEAYNSRDEPIQRSDPGGLVTRYGYDAAGNKITMTNGAGTVTYGYDADYRLLSAEYSDPATPNVSYAYDADGHRTAMTDGTGTTSYAYDAAGRLTSVQDGAGSAVAYGYDASGDVTSLTYPGGHIVTRTFDGAGRLASVADWLGNTTAFSYDPSGNVTTTSYPDGDTVTSTYNNDNALTGTALTQSGTTLASIAYLRNGDDLITKETDAGALSGTTSYGYSAQDQLTSAGPSNYSYDLAGNLTGQAGTTQDFNAADELTTSTAGGTTTSYSYDSIGDLTGASLPSGTGTSYSYNQLGELTSAAQVSPQPAVTALTTSDGPITGGPLVTISGTGFTGATAVDFGTVAASFIVVSDTQITATAPPQAAGTVDVTVTAAGGSSLAGVADQFSYLPVPVITGIAPNAGASGGGTSVTITGTGFTGATAVSFGAAAAVGFTVVSDTELTATAPAGAIGSVDVSVATPGGTSAAVTADRYTYAPAPAITNIVPAAGPASGGTAVTIAGTGFTGATAVSFGNQAAPAFTVHSATQITATAPAQAASTVDVTVTTPGGTSPAVAADQYSYLPAPAITKISRTAGPDSGGTAITITGSGFTGASAVSFGRGAAASFSVVSDTQITATAPAHSTGQVDVTVTTIGGTSPAAAADVFTFLPVPAVTQVSPGAGPVGGGAAVTVTGTGFTGATSVSFGSVAATSFTVVSDTQIDVTAPAEAAGAVDVTVTTPGGLSSLAAADDFSYLPVPSITTVTPTVGPVTGGTVVTITGTGFTGTTGVSFAGHAATGTTVVSDTEVTATAPAQAARTADVTVTTPGGTSPTVTADQFSYQAAPAITKIAPTVGPLAGGTIVTVTGAGFTGASAVSFGGVPAAGFTVVSDTEITATDPARAAGTVDITVTTPGGSSASVLADHFTYAPGPVVTKIMPAAGPVAGGTVVTITGTAFSGVTLVKFGSQPAATIKVNSSTQITATAPAHTAGAVDVIVHSPGGVSPAGAADKFNYAPVPVVSGVSPAAGPLAGGTAVTITGTGFTGTAAVSFGGTAATAFTVVSDTQITATAPAHAFGVADVTVTTAGGGSATVAADQFGYVAAPAVTDISSAAGPVGGGTTVTISGTALAGATAVDFGGVAATSFTVVSATQITATSPAGVAGVVDVTVLTAGGLSPTVAADHFTYAPAPAVTKVSPTMGPAAGGTILTVAGTAFVGATAVAVGGVSATFTVVSATQITATTPPGAVGTANVEVTTPGGTSSAVTADHYTYALVPAISKISPAAGPVAGGTMVTITGTGFTGATIVKFGSGAATSIKINSNTQITATAPAHAVGVVDITVHTPGGVSPVGSANKFTYAPVPAVSGVSPPAGPNAGGTTVTITGTGLSGASAVAFGAIPVTHVTVASSTKITAVAPAHAAGPVNVTVTTAGGTSAIAAAAQYTYTTAAAAAAARLRAAGSSRSHLASAGPIVNITASYTYNGDGLRMTETTGTGTLSFTWDTSQTTPELLSDGSNFYIYGPSGRPIEQITGAASEAYFFGDGADSTRALLASDGSVAATYTYTPYGRLLSHTGTLTTPLLFGLGYTDSPSSLLYLINRSYSATTGQFSTVDPLDTATNQPYEYTGDDPLNGIDPDGNTWWNPSTWSPKVNLVVGAIPVIGPGISKIQLLTGLGTADRTCRDADEGVVGADCFGSIKSAAAGGIEYGIGLIPIVGNAFDYFVTDTGTAYSPGSPQHNSGLPSSPVPLCYTGGSLQGGEITIQGSSLELQGGSFNLQL